MPLPENTTELTFQSPPNQGTHYGVVIGAEANVDEYQADFSKIATDAIIDMSAVLDPLIDSSSTITGYGAVAGTLDGLGVDYSPEATVPVLVYTNHSFSETPSAVKDLDESFSVTKPGDAPNNKYTIKTDFNQVDPFNRDEPGDAPFIEDVVIPEPPADHNLAAPDLYPILIKPIVSVDIPDFTAQTPTTNDIVIPTGDFTWSEEDYDSAILQATQTRISEFLEGGVGIPDYVWDAIWNRGRDKTLREEKRLITETTNEAASKGWSIPVGSQIKRIDEARQAGIQQISEDSRELVIQQAQHEIENLKYAIAQGQALEAMIGGWYQARMVRALEAAKYTYQLQVEVFNAQISLFNSEVELFNAEVTRYKTLIDAELSKLEEQKLYLEGQKIIGELNLQEVAVYEANIKAYTAEVDAYNALIKGVIAKAENNKIRMDGYATEVQAFGELVNAKTAEYEGLKAEVSAEQMKMGIFESEVKAYGTEVQAYNVMIDAAYKPNTQRQINNENIFKDFSLQIEALNTGIKDKLAFLQEESAEYESLLKAHEISLDNSKTDVDTQFKSYEVSAQIAGQTTQANIASANNYSKAALSTVQLLNSSTEVVGRAYSQLAASAMGVVSVSAGIADNTNNSSSIRTSISGGAV